MLRETANEETRKDIEILKRYSNITPFDEKDISRAISLIEMGYLRVDYRGNGYLTDLGKKFLSLVYFKAIFC